MSNRTIGCLTLAVMGLAGAASGCGSGVTCGDGTAQEGKQCVADSPDGGGVPTGAQYEIRVVSPMIPADGHSGVPVLVIGTNSDGTPATDTIVLYTSRGGAGDFAPPTATLGALGVTTYYTPCNYTTPGCAGPVTLDVALGNAPTVPVAHVDVQLVQPTGVGNPATCLTGGNVMYFDGNDYIYNGMLTVTQGTWTGSAGKQSLAIHLVPSGQSQGAWWDLDFSSAQLGTNLTPGVYDMAEREPFASPGHPGMEVTGDGRGCNTITGRFQIEDLVSDTSGNVTSATVTFEQHCEGGTAALNGCVHYGS
jgi:hypothetical protein